MEAEWPPQLQWTDADAEHGEVFRIGRDVGLRDGNRILRIMASSTPDEEHRRAAVAAVRALSERWGGSISLVLDFVGHGPPGPGESLRLCRELVQTGSLSDIALIKKGWMPRFVVSGVVKVLSGAGVPVSLREES
ncbi:MAG: hypothetical protein VX944_04650 [Myxococcota bacterium]|jgi:hypothetical protein|nr:hypothetical protein [Myxococcota bacterium]